ncbi:hypothetical protein [Paenibacillus mendelii]|uniref:Uncharacterized protein n=1 Tax=Paenibacillus mendelii TaxID=206163 RepID=A0ABV6JIC3_9BACL|nr:hypothetical protein [Paenibacillus mendelii]MCQ6557162.1 hypothetical protein [Paenibacillus mendelii]
MYIRFHGNYSSPKTEEPYGIFVVIYHLQRDGKLSESDNRTYFETKEWFEQHLPNPPYYEDNSAIKAVIWFKDNPKTRVMINKLEPLITIAAKYETELTRTVAVDPPGIVVYEDDYQIAVIKS